MHLESMNKSKFLVAISLILFFVWITLVFDARPKFQNAAGSDPLGMIHALFPNFWLLVLAFALLGIAAIYLEADTRWLHITLLIQISLVLFFTPFILGGFSWSPDSLAHGGVAGYMPEILSGAQLQFYGAYAEAYPFSYLVTYFVEQVSGVNVFLYTLYVYPIVSILTITALGYLFASKLLGSRRAFFSMLLALPALHFIEPHVSPFSAGTILVLESLVFLTISGKASKALLFLIMFAMTLTHPISPLAFGVFLAVVWALSAFCKRYTPQLLSSMKNLYSEISVSSSDIFLLGVTWISWSIFRSASIYKAVDYAIFKVVTLGFLRRIEQVTEWTTSSGFIYHDINVLNQAVYAIFLFLVLVSLFFDLSTTMLRRRNTVRSRNDKTMNQAGFKRVVLAASPIAYAGFSYMLFLATGDHHLLGRGLFYMVLLASMCISMYLVGRDQKSAGLKRLGAAALILFLFLSFPLISYSKEAYNTYTPSQGYGLSFVASRMDLSKRSISMAADQQLAAYVNLSEGILTSTYPPDLNRTKPGFIALRTTSFFTLAMRYDLSFENNQYTRLQDNLTENMGYSRVYSSPTFEVYSSTGD